MTRLNTGAHHSRTKFTQLLSRHALSTQSQFIVCYYHCSSMCSPVANHILLLLICMTLSLESSPRFVLSASFQLFYLCFASTHTHEIIFICPLTTLTILHSFTPCFKITNPSDVRLSVSSHDDCLHSSLTTTSVLSVSYF